MKILLATDGSKYSETASQFLTRIDWTPEDSITVFHAIYAVPFPEDRKFHFNTLMDVKKELAPRILDSAVALLEPVKAGISVDVGEFPPGECTPDQCILKAAASSHADLIAVGGRGTKGIASVFLGSVTRQVAIHSPLPVLVVKRNKKQGPGLMKILVAVDGSPRSRAAIEFLTSMPFPGDANVTVLHVIASAFSDLPERFSLEINDRIKDVAAGVRTREFGESERIIDEAKTVLGKTFRAVSVLSKVGDPSAEIVRIAESEASDLIVVGSGGRKGRKAGMGSVSRNVLTHAPCSVLIGKTSAE
jgi:nucleotide-binding universal stress UspA family protein